MHLQAAKLFKKSYWLYIFSFLICISTCYAQSELIIEPDRGPAPILQAIQDAKSSIDLVMYGFTDLQFAEILNRAKKNNKQVRVLLQRYPYRADAENNKVINYLQHNNVPLIWSDGDFQLTHQKTLLTDHAQAIIMTFNLTHSTFKNERNFALKITDPDEISEIQNVFNADYQHQKITVHHPNLIWSPDNSRQKILELIQSAQSNIKIYAETISDYQIIGALAKAAKNRITVSIITTKHNDKTNRKFDFLTRAGVNIYFSKDYYIHAKAIIIDDKIAILGSINLTTASINKNRELSIIIHDSVIINKLKNTFDKDWKGTHISPRPAHDMYVPVISAILTKEIAKIEKRLYKHLYKYHKHTKHKKAYARN